MLDAIVILFMLFLRIGVPLAVTIGVGYLIQRWLYKDVMLEAEEAAERGKIIPFDRRTAASGERPAAEAKMSAPCWEVTNCPPAERESCPAYASPSGRPCWMTFQLADGRLPDTCLDCDVYQLRPAAND